MKKGIVIALTLSHKNGNNILRDGDKVTENDVVNFDHLVKKGFIEVEGKPSDSDDDVPNMTWLKDDLKAKCDELKITYESSDNKEDLLEKIECVLNPE